MSRDYDYDYDYDYVYVYISNIILHIRQWAGGWAGGGRHLNKQFLVKSEQNCLLRFLFSFGILAH